MPLSGDAKRNYQRKKMAQRRQAETAKTPPNESSDGASGAPFKPFRDEAGRMVLKPGGKDLGNEHYWGWVSHATDDTRICEAFLFAGHWIGGCGMVVKWEGKPLSTNVDSEPELAQAIIDSPSFKQIQSKMPLTKSRG